MEVVNIRYTMRKAQGWQPLGFRCRVDGVYQTLAVVGIDSTTGSFQLNLLSIATRVR